MSSGVIFICRILKGVNAEDHQDIDQIADQIIEEMYTDRDIDVSSGSEVDISEDHPHEYIRNGLDEVSIRDDMHQSKDSTGNDDGDGIAGSWGYIIIEYFPEDDFLSDRCENTEQ